MARADLAAEVSPVPVGWEKPEDVGFSGRRRQIERFGHGFRDPHDRAQRQSKMCRRHGVHVINLAVRSAPIVIRSAIPARHPGFFKDRFRAGGDFDFLVLARFGGRRSRDWFFVFPRK